MDGTVMTILIGKEGVEKGDGVMTGMHSDGTMWSIGMKEYRKLAKKYPKLRDKYIQGLQAIAKIDPESTFHQYLAAINWFDE